MKKKKLYVQMLDNFALTYNGEKLVLERNGYTKASQLLQYLLYHKGRPIHRDELVSVLYEEGEVLSPQNNLKVNIFRLRKLLGETGLPSGEYITQGHSCYTWEGDLEVEIDAYHFEQLALEALNRRGSLESRRDNMLRAIDQYTGPFLPMLLNSAWALGEAAKYQELYIRLVEDASDILLQEGSGDGALAICRRAVTLCPDSEALRVRYISILLDLRNYPEASVAYDAAMRQLPQKEGWQPSAEMLALRRRMRGGADMAGEIVAAIKQTGPLLDGRQGAYYCSFSCFVDCFNFSRRIAARSGKDIYVILVTITDSLGTPLELDDNLDRAAAAVQNAIFSSLKNSDLFTRYSPSQFLVMLEDITSDNCEMVAQRIRGRFEEASQASGVQLATSLVAGHDAAEDK